MESAEVLEIVGAAKYKARMYLKDYENVIYTFVTSLLATKTKPCPGIIMETALTLIENTSDRGAALDKLISIVFTCRTKYADIIARNYVQTEIVNTLVAVGFSKLVLQPGVEFKLTSGDMYAASKLIATYAPNIKSLDRAAYEIMNNFLVVSILSAELILYLFNYASIYGEVPKSLFPIIADILFSYNHIGNIVVLMGTLSKHAVWWYCNIAHNLAPNIGRIERARPDITLSACICVQYIRYLYSIGGVEADIIARFHLLVEDTATLRAVIIKMLNWATNLANAPDVQIIQTIIGIAARHSIK